MVKARSAEVRRRRQRICERHGRRLTCSLLLLSSHLKNAAANRRGRASAGRRREERESREKGANGSTKGQASRPPPPHRCTYQSPSTMHAAWTGKDGKALGGGKILRAVAQDLYRRYARRDGQAIPTATVADKRGPPVRGPTRQRGPVEQTE